MLNTTSGSVRSHCLMYITMIGASMALGVRNCRIANDISPGTRLVTQPVRLPPPLLLGSRHPAVWMLARPGCVAHLLAVAHCCSATPLSLPPR